jgi:hypothetical protein
MMSNYGQNNPNSWPNRCYLLSTLATIYVTNTINYVPKTGIFSIKTLLFIIRNDVNCGAKQHQLKM